MSLHIVMLSLSMGTQVLQPDAYLPVQNTYLQATTAKILMCLPHSLNFSNRSKLGTTDRKLNSMWPWGRFIVTTRKNHNEKNLNTSSTTPMYSPTYHKISFASLHTQTRTHIQKAKLTIAILRIPVTSSKSIVKMKSLNAQQNLKHYQQGWLGHSQKLLKALQTAVQHATPLATAYACLLLQPIMLLSSFSSATTQDYPTPCSCPKATAPGNFAEHI